jgi:methylamine---glutamate N-methyltransferase subunit A
VCGVVALFLKDSTLNSRLGTLFAPMLTAMCDRGPDSAGFAVYSASAPNAVKITVRGPQNCELVDIVQRLEVSGAQPAHVVRDTHLVLTVPEAQTHSVLKQIAAMPELIVVSTGRSMEIYKEVGRPDRVAKRFGLDAMAGTHAIGHTRMATESAVTTDGAHPYSTGADQCLVHNGSLSNHNALRRELTKEGLSFQTENDTEVAAGYMSWRMQQGYSLEETLNSSLGALDGFYTFVVGTESGFGVLRDPIACKPAVMAETDRWVAFGTEYRALVDLPGIDAASVWEPGPAKAYLWERH